MTQDELRIREAAQSIRLQAEAKSVRWAEDITSEVFEAHRAKLYDQEQSPADKRALLQRALEAAVQQKAGRQMLGAAMKELKQTGLFDKSQLHSIQAELAEALEQIPVSLPLEPAGALRVFEPLKLGLLWGGLSSASALVMAMFPVAPALIALAPLGVSALLGALLAGLQRKGLRATQSGGLFAALSRLESPHSEGLVLPKESLQKCLQQLHLWIAAQAQYAGLLTLHRREQRQEDTDALQHLFHKCKDGLAEVYYGELKRDPERALDACIKLVGDLQDAGVQIDTVEGGEAFAAEMAALFEVAGKLEPGDPVMMIHPSWQWRGRCLAKGTLKKARRPKK